MMRWPRFAPILLVGFHCFPAPVTSQEDYGYRLGTPVAQGYTYRPAGVPIYTEALDPTVQRWYLPQTFFREYGRRQWEYTNYAERRFYRPVSASLQGNDFYDFYGDHITRGWLVYDWRQTQPLISGSSSVSQTRRYVDWFQRLLISSDMKGDFALSFMVGDEIATTLTPMTFRKSGFNGVVTSLSTPRLRATGVFSRISDPVFLGTSRSQQMTNLGGGRLEADVTDALTLGFTFVNSHNNRGGMDSFEGNPFKGFLSAEQSALRPNLILIQLTDDSPEDNEGGAILISHDVEIRTRVPVEVQTGDSVVKAYRDTVILGRSVGFEPSIQGGSLRQGLRRADGADRIILQYYLGPTPDLPEEEQRRTLQPLLEKALLLDLAESGQVVADIEEIRFRLVLANDYRVEMSSDHQTDRDGLPRFRLVTRADGNTKDFVNQREVVFSYGLPTATQIYGFTAELRDFRGLDIYGEVNVSSEYRKYPTPDRTSRRALSGIDGDRNALAFMLNASWKRRPWSVFAEGFGMEDGYTTSVLPMDRSGLPDFSPESTHLLYDFVDDNDDNDRHPDQRRVGQGALVPDRFSNRIGIDERGVADPEVFPGYDENGDFISDFNQNNNPERPNFFPDYDEPFVRYRSDRPEFLFGIDLNNNGWVERFENDDEPDYPYKRDHWGYNLFGKVELGPEAKFTVGRLRQDRRKSNEQNHTDYTMATYESHGFPRGRIRVYGMLKKAQDTIADNLVQWIVPESATGEPSASPGRLAAVPDLLAAEDTWINTLYGDWQYDTARGWSTFHRFKWETWRQRDTQITYQLDAGGSRVLDEESGDPIVVFDPLGPAGRNGRETSGFVGMINKAEYVYQWQSVQLNPRLKSEVLKATPFDRDSDKRRIWDTILTLQAEFAVFHSSRIGLGWEQRLFNNLHGDEDDVVPGERTGDFWGTALAAQLTNVSDYLGYALTTQVGLRIDRRSSEVAEGEDDTSTSGLLFLTMFASLRE